MGRKPVLLLTAAMGIVGCSSAPPVPNNVAPVIVEVARYIAYECGVPPAIVPLTMLDVEWDVATDVNGEEQFMLTPQQYENLGKNVSEILAKSKQLKAQRNFYVECIESSRDALTNPS
ncbi:MAG: hypothetical protein QQN63_00950 [Nitrosopumilus sp.]